MNIVIIGSGKLATGISTEFLKNDHAIIQVYSRSLSNAALLAKKIKCPYTDDLKNLLPHADLYLIAVRDDAILKVIKELKIKNKIVVHTSGAVSIDVFKNSKLNAGIFWPMHSFNNMNAKRISNSLICVEAFNKKTETILLSLAQSLSKHTQILNSKQRLALHCAAVFANNFTNYIYTLAGDILNENQLNFNLIKPIILQTARKVQNSLPRDSQTGPALRNEKKTMHQHIAMLKNDADKLKIYKLISHQITKANKK